MFDVPVPEVTVSSVPAFIEDIGQTTQTTLRTPQVASALLNALPVLTQTNPVLPQTAATAVEGDTTQTLVSNNSFQLLEPLNLADAAKALEKAFAYSLNDIPSRATGDNPRPRSELMATVESADDVSTKTNVQQSIVTLQTNSTINTLGKLAPVLVASEELNRCIDMPYETPHQGITTFQVWLRGNQVGEINSIDSADEVIRSLQEILVDAPFNPNDITPVLNTDQPAIDLGNDITIQVSYQEITEDTTETIEDNYSSLSEEWAAIAWSDQFRQKLGATPLDAGDVHIKLKGLQPSNQQLDGIASWYGPYFHGRLTANGETFDQNTLTAAHKSLPFNTILQVRNLKNNRTVVVRINDRGPYIGKRSLDLSKAAAQCLGSEHVGVIPYEATILESASVESPTE